VDRPLEAGRAHAVLACLAAQDRSSEDAIGHIDVARKAGSNQLTAGAGAWLRDAQEMLAPRRG
jgi:hypothetical protein